MKFKKNDTVQIMAGKDKGKTGTIDRVYKDRVLVPGLNVYKKHIKKTEQTPQGGLVELSRPFNVAKIAVVCPTCKKFTRVGYQMNGKTKQRICKKCKSII